MGCETVRMPGGGVAIVCGGRGRRRARCRCGAPAELQCDGRIGKKRDGSPRTCDVYLCASCATEVAPEKHLCPEHNRQWRARIGKPLEPADVPCEISWRGGEMRWRWT